MHKAIKHPNIADESVLSNDPWLFSELWLKRQGKSESKELPQRPDGVQI